MSLQEEMMTEAVFPAQLAVRGETVTYHPDGEDDVSIEGIFRSNSPELADAEPGGFSDVRTGTLWVDKTELASVSRDDEVTIGSEKWTVVTFEDRGYAWRLNIRRPVAVERGARAFRIPRM